MSRFYNSKRTRNVYSPKTEKPFKISRTKIDLFVECPRCFYLDRKLGVSRPSGYPFNLNKAVDKLLKQEFDFHRHSGDPHPLIAKYNVDAYPVEHEQLNKWRENFVGIQFFHEPTNLIITGAIDDLWKNSKDEYIVVDYKATSKNEKITSLNKDWQIGYKRQMETYQWLLRQNGYTVSDTGYFVYANAIVDERPFDGKLEFNVTLIPYKGKTDWIDNTINDIYKCLQSQSIPKLGSECDYCAYCKEVGKLSK